MRIIFTGQSGQSIDSSLKQFIKKFKIFAHDSEEKPLCYKVETYIEKIYKERNSITSESKKTWTKFLKESYLLQQVIWIEAFNKILEEVEMELKERPNANIFIIMHSVFFHKKTQEYLSIVNLDLLKKFSPDKIITLIDDICDIRRRLSSDENDIFFERSESSTPSDERMEIAFQLRRVLDWRSKEIMMSRFIAKELKIVNNVFAMKHPWDTLYNLALKDKPTVYLSHPISEPRRLEMNSQVGEYNKIKNEISQISDSLCESFTTFLPTTIDEFRINKFMDKIPNEYYTSLGTRWDKEKYIDPKEMLYSVSGFNDEDALWKSSTERTMDLEFNYIIKSLNDMISSQVTSRDYMLVEQSRVLVVYRPLYNGNASGGVQEENSYYEDGLRALEIVSGKHENLLRFVYCPKKDIERYIVEQFNSLIRKYISQKIFAIKNGHEKFIGMSVEDSNKLISIYDSGDELRVLDHLKYIKKKHHILIVNDPSNPILVVGPLKDIEGKLDNIEEMFVSDFNKNVLNVIKIYKQSTFDDSDIFDLEKFIAIIKEKLKEHSKLNTWKTI